MCIVILVRGCVRGVVGFSVEVLTSLRVMHLVLAEQCGKAGVDGETRWVKASDLFVEIPE